MKKVRISSGLVNYANFLNAYFKLYPNGRYRLGTAFCHTFIDEMTTDSERLTLEPNNRKAKEMITKLIARRNWDPMSLKIVDDEIFTAYNTFITRPKKKR